MKKYLSVVLAIMMVLSCSVFAAPSVVGTADTTAETTVDVSDVMAEVAEETEETEETELKTDVVSEQLVFEINFDNLTSFSNKGNLVDIASVYNVPSDFPAGDWKYEITSATGAVTTDPEDATNKYLTVTPPSKSYNRMFVEATGIQLPNGTYRVAADMKAVSSVIMVATIHQAGTGRNKPLSKSNCGLTTSWQNFSREFEYVYGETYSDAGFMGLSGFQFYQNNNLIEWYIDNYSFYYTPAYYTVSFAGGGFLPEDVKVTQNGTFVPSEFAPSKHPEEGDFLGWSLTEGGEIITEPITVTGDVTLYSVYDIETTSAYGKLAYFVDFNGEVGTTVAGSEIKGTPLSDVSLAAVPKLDGMPKDIRIEAYGSDVYTLDGDALIMKNTGGAYPRWYLSAYEDGKLSKFPVGIYTLEWSSKTSLSGGSDNTFAINGTDGKLWPTNHLGTVAVFRHLYNEYKTFTGTVIFDGSHAYKVDSTTAITHGGTNSDDLSGGLGRFCVYSPCSDVTVERTFDWAKLWYAPLTVELKYDANGKDVQVPETADVSSIVDFANLPKLADCGTSRFVGWAESPDGQVVLEGQVIYSEDLTLYAIWDDGYYAEENEDLNAGKILAHLHFNNITIGSSLNSQIVNYGVINEDFAVNHSSGKTFPDIIYSDATNNEHIEDHPANIWFGADYVKYMNIAEDGSIKYADNAVVFKAVKSEATKSFYPKFQLVNNSRGTFKDGIYTFVAQVIVEEDANIDKVGYTAFANGVATEIKYINPGESTYVKASMLILNGKLYDYESMRNTGSLGAKITNVGFNFDFKMKEAVLESPEIIGDNFRIYYKPYDGAAKSYTENSIRIGNDVSGIRFKASVSSVERANENLTEYGFIVTRSALLDAAGVEKDNFTAESAVKYVSGVNYSKEQNIDKIFETNGENFFFTAVVYGIPAGNYADTLVVRPYVVIDGTKVYGEAMENSIYDVALKLKDSEYYEEYKEAIDNILAGNELA